MNDLKIVVGVLTAIAAILAIVVAARRREHLPVAVLLTVVTLANRARPELGTRFIRPAQDMLRAIGLDPLDVPLWGWPRVAGHAHQALGLLWPAGIIGLSVAAYLTRRSWVAWAATLVPWVASVAYLVWAYPWFRGLDVKPFYLVAELVALLVGVGGFLHWLFWGSGTMNLTRAATLFIVGIDATTLLTLWRADIFAEWPLARGAYLVLYTLLVLVHGGALWLSYMPSKSPR